MKAKTLIFILLLVACPLMSQNRYHVNATTGNDANDGLSWSKAYATLQAALELAQPNDEIWVAAGTYLPTKAAAEKNSQNEPVTHRHKTFVLPAGVSVYGGFPASADDNTGFNVRDWESNETILSGDLNQDDTDDFTQTSDNAYHVLILIDADKSTQINGFTITGGNADGTDNLYVGNTPVSNDRGGGIYAYTHTDTEASPVIMNVRICKNAASGYGGGFFNYSAIGKASPQISYSSISENKCDGTGGGLYNDAKEDSSPVLINVIISGNQAAVRGGGAYILSEEKIVPTLLNTLISGNISKEGGGLFCYTYTGNATPILTNVTISGNKVSEAGAGFVCLSYSGISTPNIRNSVIWGNRAKEDAGLYSEGNTGSKPNIHNSLIEGEPVSSTYGNLSGDVNPVFADAMDANYAPTTDGDYQLSATSPLINKGNNSFVVINSEKMAHYDLNGNPRIVDNTIDIGAYEYQETGTGSVEITGDNRIWAYAERLHIKVEQPVTIRVYTVGGSLLRQIDRATEGTVVIPLPPGIYFVSLNGDTATKVYVPRE